jgi:hypothetical protein
MHFLGWIIGPVLVISGIMLYPIFKNDLKLAIFESEDMARNGVLEGEPEYMGSFRSTRALYDADSALRNMRRAKFAALLGVAIILYLVVTKSWI